VTEVIFYTGINDKFEWLAKTSQNILARKKTAILLVADSDRSLVFEKLWTHTDISFIASCEDELDSNRRLILGPPLGLEDREVYINFSEDIPLDFSSWRYLLEYVPEETSSREAARKKYKWYQERGYPLKTLTRKA
jgi:DNA polymerase-3 subunit chi